MSRTVTSRPPWIEAPSGGVRLLKIVILLVIAAIMIFPFVSVILSSFAASGSVLKLGLIPDHLTAQAYWTVLSGGVVTRALLVSIGITVAGTLLSLIFTTTLAFGLTRTRDVPGARPILYLVLFSMLFGAGIIPNYLLVKGLGLIDSYASLILPGLISAFNLVVIRNFFMQIPRDLLEAARLDGASEFRIFASIVLPLSKAIIAVIGLFYAVGYWNSFFTALLYLNDTAKWPIQLVLNQYVIQSSPLDQIQNPDVTIPPPESIQMAVVVLATLPILIVYPFVQRHFTKGVLTGAIKG